MITHDSSVAHGLRQALRLVVAPHPGDEVLGCGGMLAKHCDDSAVVLLADADEVGRGQTRTAQRVLGGPDFTCFGLSAGHLADDLDQIVGALADLVAQVRPTEVYLPYPLAHHDHLVAFEAGMRATRALSPGDSRANISVLLYHLDAVAPEDYPADIRWSVCEPLVAEDIDRKVAAAIAYRSALAHSLKRRAVVVGAVRNLPWAEQFALIRSARADASQDDLAPAAAPDLELVAR